FHYERDIWRANQVRNSWVTKDREAAGFWDASLWEEAKKKGGPAIKKMIDDGLKNTSVTAVLIGCETADREYVQYEIEQSIKRGNGLLGIYIHKLKNQDGDTDCKGDNPFDQFEDLLEEYDEPATYDWKLDDGYNNFGDWVEDAAKKVGR
ncbi:MAG: TIR domain-containing protein, partial [Spirochaetota bacterium]|nr:TIR domain-containing protein [Spirochaetota bacterium]